MKDLNLNPDTQVNPIARERFYSGSKEDAVLVIHGFTGIPAEMEYLGKEINKKTGYTVYIPRLPGHGTNRQDFLTSGARDWLRKIYDSYLNLKADYKNVHLAGLSMGGLLALLTAARFNHSAKLILIAAALYANHPLLPYSHIIKFFKKEIKNDPEVLQLDEEGLTPEDKLYREHYWGYTFPVQGAELHKLMRLTRKKLPQISCNTLIIASKKDDTVPLKAAYTIKNNIKSKQKKLVILENSPHVINDGPEKDKCARIVTDFLLKTI
ncbi:alpha/beta hydrolase [Halothermothrix orenii]|uniref:Carboxylesterase n=1 Tax=Halothermothrix orenii (strain H 168 / OCM 544 / DSM 9562) TaxID=373903 RepID=B8CWA6_HALOH|nr:alpha/beta fold hydrolase [Halothermothrix orenii]ACL69575.1 carboxylesterase [Halothermothrix orenii H 168]